MSIEQKDPFTGTQTSRPPRQKAVDKGKKREYEAATHTSGMSTSSNQPVVKRPKTFGISPQRLMDSFFQSMRDNISKKVNPIIRNQVKLKDLKKQLLAAKKLPPGVIVGAEKICQCAKNELRDHLEHHGTKQNFQYFQEYVKDHFDTIVASLQPQASTSISIGESASTSATPVVAPGSPVALLRRDLSAMDTASRVSSVSGAQSHAVLSSISHNPSDVSMADALPEGEDYRTCTVSFKSLLRKVVPPDLAKSFLDKMSATMCAVSDYVIDLQLAVLTLMLSMKSFQLSAPGGGSPQMKKARGFQIRSILPEGFEMKTDVTTSAPSLPSSALKSTAFCNGVKELFQSKHISYLHTSLFGERGTMSSHATFDALSSNMKPTLDAITASNTPRPAHQLMILARELYQTNLKNMWAKNKLFNKTLNKLLEILLRVHLAPKRESHYQQLKHKRAKKQAKKKIVKSSRNAFHNAIRSEKYKLQRYKRKAKGKAEGNSWARLATQGQERINRMYADVKRAKKDTGAPDQASGSISTAEVASANQASESASTDTVASVASTDLDDADVLMNNLLALDEILDKEEDQEDDQDGKGDGDLPRRKILILKAILRKLLVQQAGKTITPAQLKKERPDITDKESRICLLLAKALLPYIPTRGNYSYIGFQLPFLLLANDILRCVGYSKFAVDLCPSSSCGSLHAMRLDAVSVYTLCTKGDNPMDIFDFQGFLIESARTARQYKDAVFNSVFDIRAITNACKSFGLTFAHNITVLPGLSFARILGAKPGASKPVFNTRKPLDIDWNTVRELQAKTDQVLKSDIAQMELDITAASDELKTSNKERKKEDYSAKIKELQKQHRNDRSKRQEVEQLKGQRYQSFIATKQIKQRLSNLRTRAFLTRKAIEYRSKEIPIISNSDAPPAEQDLNAMRFSGTDNGLAVMTETVGMDLSKYRYHLSLHNRFSPLAILDADDGDVSGSTGAAASAAANDGNGDDQDTTDGATGIGESHVDDAAPTFEPLPKSYKMRAEDVDFGSGQFIKRKITIKDKNTTEAGKEVKKAEEQLSKSNVFRASVLEDIRSNLAKYKSSGPALRAFYHSKKMNTLTNKVEYIDRRFRSRFASSERAFCTGGRPQTCLTMFIGDRGLCVGSRLKGHLKYGGKWKPRLHQAVATVCTTNEHKTSQTCIYCFGPTSHPTQTIKAKDGRTKTKSIHGAFLCLNPNCVSVVNSRAIQSRDKMSALAIAVSGLSSLLFKQPLPVQSETQSIQHWHYLQDHLFLQ
ncbi:unnamed protein product [Mucor fragilis]